MSWVVDTCVLLDIFEEDPEFAELSADALDAHSAEGLAIAPVSYVELSPAFHGDRLAQDEFLAGLGIVLDADGMRESILAAHKAWGDLIMRKKAGGTKRRPIADVLIGAFAMRKGGLITRNADDFRTVFPNLPIVEPQSPRRVRKAGGQKP